MPVAIQIDARQLKNLERKLGGIEKGVPKALAPAINTALAKGQTTIKREIRKEYLIKAKDIPTAIHRATYSSLNAHILVRQGMLDASKFVYRPKAVQKRKNKKPLFVQIKKSGGGFIARGFVSRLGPMQRRSFAPRLPIRKILTIGAAIMASQPNVGPAVNKAMGETLAKRIDYEMKRVLARIGGYK
jgi:Prophage minor tail protein Z (GPZ).